MAELSCPQLQTNTHTHFAQAEASTWTGPRPAPAAHTSDALAHLRSSACLPASRELSGAALGDAPAGPLRLSSVPSSAFRRARHPLRFWVPHLPRVASGHSAHLVPCKCCPKLPIHSQLGCLEIVFCTINLLSLSFPVIQSERKGWKLSVQERFLVK